MDLCQSRSGVDEPSASESCRLRCLDVTSGVRYTSKVCVRASKKGPLPFSLLLFGKLCYGCRYVLTCPDDRRVLGLLW